MTRFTTFLALVVGGMEVIPAAGVLAAGLATKIHLGLVGVDPFQRRQGIPPATCDSLCTPIITTVISNVSHTK
jgi:hypothetical protein